MRYTLSVASKKYAKAFLQEFHDSLTIDQVQNFKTVIKFFKQHSDFLSIVSVLASRYPESCTLLEELKNHFGLPASVEKLIQVLIAHKKLHIFSEVLQDIYCLYMLKNNILEVTIATAAALEEDQKQKFEEFFKKLSGKKIISSAIIDESLIAGIRMQSDLFLWENSIKSRIAKLSRNMLDEE